MYAARIIAARGKRQSLTAWAAELHIEPATIRQRLRRGADNESALAPVGYWRGQQGRRLRAMGRDLTLSGWARELHVTAHMLRQRLRRGWTPHETVSVKPGVQIKFGRRKAKPSGSSA
jgi:hypothetical protein